VTLATTVRTISDRVFRRNRVSDFPGHRLPLTGSRWDIRLRIDRRTKPTLCVLPVRCVAAMEKSCDPCGDGEYFLRTSLRRQRVYVSQRHRPPLTGSRWDIRRLIGRRTKPTLCVFPVFRVVVMESVVTLATTVRTPSGPVFRRNSVSDFPVHRQPLTGSRWDIRRLIGRRTQPTVCDFSVLSVAAMEKCCDACDDGENYLRSGFSAS
jgi:hypothetical protein